MDPQTSCVLDGWRSRATDPPCRLLEISIDWLHYALKLLPETLTSIYSLHFGRSQKHQERELLGQYDRLGRNTVRVEETIVRLDAAANCHRQMTLQFHEGLKNRCKGACACRGRISHARRWIELGMSELLQST
jgi:hypothetical protein